LPGYRSAPLLGFANYLQLPDHGLEGTISLSRELTAPSRLLGNDDLSVQRRKATALEKYLAESGGYLYSLNMSVENPQTDPIEEFVMTRKRGHCEYFGSALVMMLRAVDIPSRLVIGFKGADFHAGETPEDGYYEVQQRHAHAWVEAFVDGEWIVLDPTPAAREESVRQVAATAGFWKNAKNSISDLWSTYIVSLSFDRQQNSLYAPVSGAAKSIRKFFDQLKDGIITIQDFLSTPQAYFSRKGTIITGAILLLLMTWRLLWRAFAKSQRGNAGNENPGVLRMLYRWIVARLTGRPLVSTGVMVAFYQQFQVLMDSAGLVRRGDQTQREFAHDVERILGDRLAPAGLLDFPGQLCDLFYRVRFGGEMLQPADVAEVESRLDRLDSLLNQRPGTMVAVPAAK
jgi:hypothetical protein